MRKMAFLALVAAALLLPWGVPAEAQFSPCQFCWTASGEYGQCQDVVTPSPSLSTYSDCQGIKRCFPVLGGELHCQPACTGNEVVVWPTSSVVGKLDLPSEAASTGILCAGFVAALDANRTVQGEVVCAVDGSSFECELPAAVLDVRLATTGFAPHYLWALPVEVRKTRDLGVLRMVPGASVAGSVDWSGDPDGVSVTLAPEILGVPPPEVGRRLESRALESGIDARGHFQFTGLAPGTYVAVASAANAGSSPRWEGIVLAEGVEVYLEEPLRIRPPAVVQVVVSPAFDHRLEPWTVTLRRELSGSTYVETVASAATEADGSVELPSVDPGTYQLHVDDSSGARLHSGAIEVGGRPIRVDIAISAVVVRGEVTRGGVPFEARLVFANGRGERTEILSDDAGRFSGTLAEEGTWVVEVLPTTGSSRRLLGRPLEVLRGEDDVAWVPIELPGTSLVGRVEDEDGEPVARALVTVLRGGRLLAQAWSQEGDFEIDGLEPGSVMVRAESRSGSQSSAVTVEIEEDGESDPLTLVVAPSIRLPVEVRYQGLPVAGARIRYFTPDGAVQGEMTSSPSGRAELVLPPRTGVVDLVALAARLPTRVLRLRLGPEVARPGTARIDLPTVPGTLLVPVDRQRRRIVFGGEVELMIWNLLPPAGSAPPPELDPAAGLFRIPIGEGRYGLCDDEGSRCTEGNLAPGGVLDLGSGRQEPEEPSPARRSEPI